MLAIGWGCAVTADRPSPGGRADRPGPRGLASLRGRLVLAFTAVAVAAIALVSAAAAIGTDQGLSAQAEAGRQALADRAADAASAAYQRGGGWDGVDLGPVISIASGAGARIAVRSLDGRIVGATTGPGQGMRGMNRDDGTGGPGMGAHGAVTLAPVAAGGTTVGSVTLFFSGEATTAGRPVAWTWIGAAAAAALTLAVAAAWVITRMLTRPLGVLTSAARAFAGGDRGARAGVRPPGELGELAAAFDDAAEQVQLSERARRQLSADVAHELRTPLAALQAGLEELRDGLAPADAEALARLHDQTLRLGRVVKDLAELSAAEAARLTLHPESVDLTAVVSSAADDYEAPLRAAGLRLARQLGGAAPVHGDAERLHQVVGNLLQNCARHCRPGDEVTLTVQDDPGAGLVRLIVTDTGPGIPPEALPQVFTRFWRSGTGRGSGLGLAIVASLIEAHRGAVRIDSDGRSGTAVTVELPRERHHPVHGPPGTPRGI